MSLDSAVWVDVARHRRTETASSHGHGAPCSGIHKQVDFDLAPGRYVLQLSGVVAAVVRVMVFPA